MSTSTSTATALDGSFPARSHQEGVVGAPLSFTSFVGRETEMSSVHRLLATTRLLTITGAGGSGKTRFASELVARYLVESRGVWVELAPVQDAALVPETVLSALGIREQAETQSPIEHLAEIIGGRAFLLVLDNCEHVIDASALLADALLRRCPNLEILVTSREALGVSGETAWLIPPLSLSESGDGLSDAARLFVDRAKAVLPSFCLSADNRLAIAQICRRLDGLPLAVELAAARLRVLTPEQITERLDDRFRLLKTGNRAALPRHQTLRAVIDWSYDLLLDAERLLLDRLAVFRGGFTLEAAEWVCSGDSIEPEDVLDVVSSLVEKSLVEMCEQDDTARYRLLETVRQYGIDRLTERDELAARERRHAEFFFALVWEAEPHFTTVRRPGWVMRIQADLDNIRQALGWSGACDAGMHMRIVGMLHGYWFASGQWPEARQWLSSALQTPISNQPTRERAAVLFSAGAIACLQGRAESALIHLDEAEQLADALGEHRLLAYVRNYRGMSFNQTHSPEAERPARLALEWFRMAEDFYGLRLSFLLLGAWHQNRDELPAAIAANEEGVRVARVFGLDRELSIALQCLGMAVMQSKDLPRAVSLLRESLEGIRRDPHNLILARGLEMLASCIASEGAVLEAAQIYGAAQSIRDMIGAKMWKFDAALHAPIVAAARKAVGNEEFEHAFATGRSMSSFDAITFALDASQRLDSGNEDEPSTNTAEYQVVIAAQVVPTPGLRVHALGELRILVDGAAIPAKAWGYAKARELLLLLLWHASGRTREQIGVALWPDASAAQVRNNFHVTLHHLRKALGRADWVRFERDRYRILDVAKIAFDARDFEECMTDALKPAKKFGVLSGSLDEALDLYKGHFLEHESAGDWHLEVRDRLCRLRSHGLELLGAELLRAQRFDEAATVFQLLVDEEPADESACRGLMSARTGAGDRTGAVREYRRLESVLLRELGATPSSETTELMRSLLR